MSSSPKKRQINTSGTNSCVIYNSNLAEYCTGTRIIPIHHTNTLVKTLYNSKAKERYDAEIAAARILAGIDRKQEDFLYVIAGCEFDLTAALQMKCKIQNEIKTEEKVYMLEMQDGGESLETADIEFTEEEAKKVVDTISDKLGKLHTHHIVHGDFHGGNVVIDKHKHIRFIDFAGLKQYTKEDFDSYNHKNIDLHRFSTILDAIYQKTVESPYKNALNKTAKDINRVKPGSINGILFKLHENLEIEENKSPSPKHKKGRRTPNFSPPKFNLDQDPDPFAGS